MVRYRLRTMVLARMLSEVIVLLGMIAIPVFLVATGKLPSFSAPVQGMLIALGVIALAIVPWFGFITWLVTTDENGVSTHALFKKQFCAWTQIKGLTRRASWNWLRFVVEYEGGELTFPVLLNKCDALVREIRSHLQPGALGSGGGAGRNPDRTFVYDRIAMSLQIIQSVAAIIFVGLFWLFFTSKAHHFKPGSNDAVSLLIFCALATLVFAWRCWVVAWMPKSMRATRSELIVSTHFNEKHIRWPDILSLGVPLPLLPEGFTIKTKQGSILVGSGMDSGDELHEIIQHEIAAKKSGVPSAASEAMKNIDFAQIERLVRQQLERSDQFLKLLAENQVALDAEREIRYHFLAHSAQSAEQLAAHLAAQGCQTEVVAPQPEPEATNQNYTIEAAVLQSPAAAGSESNTAFLIGLADQHSCFYDGWSTPYPQAASASEES